MTLLLSADLAVLIVGVLLLLFRTVIVESMFLPLQIVPLLSQLACTLMPYWDHLLITSMATALFF